MTYRTGGTVNNGGTQSQAAPAITLTGVQPGDVIFIWAIALTLTGTPATISCGSTGTAPVPLGNPQTGTEPLPASVTGRLFTIVASQNKDTPDAGKVVSVTTNANAFIAVTWVAHSGANVTVPVVNGLAGINSAFGGANTASVTCPTIQASDPNGTYGLFFGGGAAEGGSLSAPATSRINGISSSDVAAVASDTNAVIGSGTNIGGGAFTTGNPANSVLVAFTVLLSEAPVTQIVGAWQSTDGNGCQTWSVTCGINGPGAQTLRIQPPSAGSGSYSHSFLYALPVTTGVDPTNGDPPTVFQSLNAMNTYNFTLVVPSFPIDPWYADNPNNAQQHQETFMLSLVTWMHASQFATGGELDNIIGFSKSGIGGQGLIFHHPTIFNRCASWDAPFKMKSFDGQDDFFPGAPVGGNPANAYGTNANFLANYWLSDANIATWNAAAGGVFTSTEKIWLGGYFTFQGDVNAYMTQLTNDNVKHNQAWNQVDSSHAWHNDWVAAALAWMFSFHAVGTGNAIVSLSVIAVSPHGHRHGTGPSVIELFGFNASPAPPPLTPGFCRITGPAGASVLASILPDEDIENVWAPQVAFQRSDALFQLAFRQLDNVTPYNLTGYLAILLLKDSRFAPDDPNRTYVATNTNAVSGLAQVAVPGLDLVVPGVSWYRIDLSKNGKKISIAFGPLDIQAV